MCLKNSKAPTWLQGAMTNLSARYPQDRFELIQKKASTDDNWRIKCLDCPGKVSVFGSDLVIKTDAIYVAVQAWSGRDAEQL